MRFEILFPGASVDELTDLRAFDQRRITEAIEEQLRHKPTSTSRNRKNLGSMLFRFEHVPPVWELRVGEFRVFYNVSTEEAIVNIRAIRKKGQGQNTEDII